MHAQVRGLDQLDDALLAARRRGRRCASVTVAGGERGGDLAGLRAAHAVGDRERAAARRRSSPRCGAASGPTFDSARRRGQILIARTSGRSRRSRTTSPGTSRRSPVRRMPFTKVPLVEPMSSTYTPSRRGSKRAWCAEANSSPATAGRCLRRGPRSARSSLSRRRRPPAARRSRRRRAGRARARPAGRAAPRPVAGRGSSTPAAGAGRARPSGRSAR